MALPQHLRELKIAVAFGSRSPEHDVSIITGIFVLKTLQGMGLNAEPLYIDQDGVWRHAPHLGVVAPYRDGRAKKTMTWNVEIEKSIASQKLILTHAHLLKTETREYDMVFPCFHGSMGEDGAFQGLMEMIRVPYAGPRIAAAALAMDKDLTKLLFRSLDVPTTSFRTLHKSEDSLTDELILSLQSDLGTELFIKPATLGSSIGICRASTSDEALKGLEMAYFYDPKVVVESAVDHLQDITVAVCGGPRVEYEASLIQQSLYHDDLLTYEDKYLRDGGAQTGKATSLMQIPADLPSEATEYVRSESIRICQAMGMTGNCRVDWLRNQQTGEIYANEINTIPGTMYHHLWEASGKSFPELLQKMIEIALQHDKIDQQKHTTFSSTLLQTAGGVKGAKLSTENL